jgi:hypothetical protein
LKTIAEDRKIPLEKLKTLDQHIAPGSRLWNKGEAPTYILLPKKSATGAAVKAPRNVPKDRMETINDSSPGSMAGSPSSLTWPLAKLAAGQ